MQVSAKEDGRNKKASIVLYLVGEWFAMTKYPVDRTNTSRAELSDEWQLVKERFLTWAGGTEDTQKAGKRAAKVVVDVGAATHCNRGDVWQKSSRCAGYGIQRCGGVQEAVLALLFDKWDWKESIAEKALAFLAHPGRAFAIVEVSGECS